MNTLEFYKELRKTEDKYTLAYYLICYNSVDAYIDNPTDEEFETIAENCVNVYMKADDCDLGKLADIVSMKYSEGDFTLEELDDMSKWDILDMIY